MPNLKFYKGNKSNLPSTGVSGSIYISEDTAEIYVTKSDNKLQKYTDLIILNLETDRTGLLTPIANKFYYVKEKTCLWFYNGITWDKITKDFPTSLPANGGNSDTVDNCHVDDTKTDSNSLLSAQKIYNLFGVTNQSIIDNEYKLLTSVMIPIKSTLSISRAGLAINPLNSYSPTSLTTVANDTVVDNGITKDNLCYYARNQIRGLDSIVFKTINEYTLNGAETL